MIFVCLYESIQRILLLVDVVNIQREGFNIVYSYLITRIIVCAKEATSIIVKKCA